MSPEVLGTLDAIREAVAGLTPAQLGWQPPGKWSAAEILEHLQMSFSASAARLERAVEKGTPLVKPDTWRQRLGAFVVVGLGYFPTGHQAPEYVQPAGMPAAGVLQAAVAALERFDTAAARCGEVFGPDTKVTSHPILGAFTVKQWRRFHRVHTAHHLKQIADRRRDLPAGV